MKLDYGKKYPLIPFEPNSLGIDLNAQLHSEGNNKIDLITFTLNDPMGLVNSDNINSKKRSTELWNATCFEMFLKKADGSYFEFNFALNFAWNCYSFTSYRQGPLTEFSIADNTNPIRDILLSREKKILIATLPLEIKKQLNAETFSLGLSCVLKDIHDQAHYYALKHADTRANFHHPESFILEI